MNISAMLQNSVRKYPKKTFIVCGERRLTFSDIDGESDKIASFLLKLGLKKGERVATLMSNSPEFVTTFFGIMKAGGIAVLLDIRYTHYELASLFANCEPVILLAESVVLKPLIPYLAEYISIKHVIEMYAETSQFLRFETIKEETPLIKPNVNVKPEDVALISYTGGPTNHPHGAALTHISLVEEAANSARGFLQTEKDTVALFALPMYHMFALGSVLLTSVYTGSGIVIVPGTGRSIHSLLDVIEKEKVTIYMGVPYIYALMISVAERESIKHDLSSMRLWGSGGAPLLVEIIDWFKQYYGFTIVDVWGLTEAVSHISCSPAMRDGHFMTKPGSAGKHIHGWEFKIVDDAGKKLPAGEIGELIIRGNFMAAYWRDPGDTAKIIKNGWLSTGDLGKLDNDGYIYITGLKKRMLILKGQNIYPEDIEIDLRKHPKIADAVVTGIPDKLRGHVIGAAIRLKPGETATEQDIRRYCAEHMADYKMPRVIIFTSASREDALAEVNRKALSSI